MKKNSFLKSFAIGACACVCSAAMAVGIYAATSHSYELNSTITFNTMGVSGTIKGELKGAVQNDGSALTASQQYFNQTNASDGNPFVFNNTYANSGNTWNISNVSFAVDGVSLSDITVEIVVANAGGKQIGFALTYSDTTSTNLDVSFSAKLGADEATARAVTTGANLIENNPYIQVGASGTSTDTIVFELKYHVKDLTLAGPSSLTPTMSFTLEEYDSNKYGVAYFANGATSGTVVTDVVTTAATLAVKTVGTETGNINYTAPTGASFLGWNTSADGTGTTYQPGATITLTQNTTLYAQWGVAIVITGITDSTAGSAAVLVGEKSLLNLVAPQKANHIIEGYYIDSSYTTKVADIDGNLLASVSDYTDNTGAWTRTTSTTLYAQMLEPGLYLNGTYSTENNNFVSWADLVDPANASTYWANSNNSPIVDNGNGTYSIGGQMYFISFNIRALVGSLVIPSSVTSIGNYAFYYCTGLTNITIPSSVTSIGESAFGQCTGLTNITIGGGVTSIGYQAFAGCLHLTNITIGGGVTSIGYQAFENCRSLTNITIPSSVTSIGEWAFENCDSLTNITIGGGVTSIGERAFENCSSLNNITIPSSVTSIGNCAFEYCFGLTNITIPSSVTSIGNYAFSNTAFKTNLANTVEAASTGVNTAFVENNVYYLTCSDDATKYICFGAIGSTKPTGDLTIKSGTVCLVGRAFDGCTGLTSITIPSSVTSIGQYTFLGCSGLTNITIPSSVTSIGEWAFDGCTGLTSITIPSSVTSIGRGAFYCCTGLTNITIPSSVTSIGHQAFRGCSGLTSITIPSSVTSIGHQAFLGCSGLTNITIPSSVTSIGESAFSSCTGLTNITIPSGVTSIGESAFSGCTGLTNITIPSSVTSIGVDAFAGTAFKTNLANTVEAASTGVNTAFVENNVYYLTCSDDATKYICFGAIGSTKPTGDLTIKSGTVCLVDRAFAGCSGLTNITIPSSVTSIGKRAFENCFGLTNITIGGGVTSIGEWAFNVCTGLTTINYTGTQAQWNAISGHGNAESASNPTRTINYNYVAP